MVVHHVVEDERTGKRFAGIAKQQWSERKVVIQPRQVSLS